MIVRGFLAHRIWITGWILMGMCIQAFPVQPDSLNFIVPSSGETGYWPGESIAVKAWWSAAAESLYCRIQNHDNDDSLTVLLIPDTEDTNIASISLEFQTGWELAAESINDELLQCSYGNRISVNSAGMADSCRILVEEASIQLDPSDTIFVGTDIALTWIDRDANVDYGQIDSVSLTLRSVSTGHSAIALLRETSVQSGIFRGHVPVSCDLAVEEDSVAIRVLDADSIVVEGFDSLFASGTWDEGIESSPVDTVIAISTRTAVIEARHSVYGDLNLFPIAGDSMIITIHEHDLEGVDSIAIDVGVYSPDGNQVDSLLMSLSEGSPGQFTSGFTIDENNADLSAQIGDSLIIEYEDRADSSGIPSLIVRSLALGAHIIQGDITDTVWDSETPYLIVDSSFVSTGNELRVAGGINIQVVPEKNIALIVDGNLIMGSEAEMDTVHIGASSTRRASDQWAGIIVRGNLNMNRTIISHARIGVFVEENGILSARDCLFELNGAATGRNLFERRAHYNAAYVKSLPPGLRGWPGAISATSADILISDVTIQRSDGYGISVRGGSCDIDSVDILECMADGILMVETTGTIANSSLRNNHGGGIYGYGSSITLAKCHLGSNTLEGMYSVSGSVTAEESMFNENLHGGILLRDECRCSLNGIFVTGNHQVGIDAAWGCLVEIDGSAVIGNGGNGMAIDYETDLTIHNSSVAYNRVYAIHVGSWSLDDSLDARQCWWGEFPPSADSTGVNLDAIWDGFDVNGRSQVLVSPALEHPPSDPAPQEQMNVQGGVLELSSGWATIGDTVTVHFIPESFEPTADFTVAVVLSPRDTVLCILQRNETTDVFENRVEISDEEDPLAPDKIAALFGDRITAFLLADSTISTALLPAEHDPAIVRFLSLDAYPSPFNDILTIHWNAYSPPVLMMYDLSGREVLKKQLNGAVGKMNIDVQQVRSISPGVYVIRISGDSFGLCRRVVHIR